MAYIPRTKLKTKIKEVSNCILNDNAKKVKKSGRQLGKNRLNLANT